MAPAPTMDRSWSPVSKATSVKPAGVAHPLCPLTAMEIKKSAELIRERFPSSANLQFKVITLEEPPKVQLVPYLDAEHNGKPLPDIDRRAFASYYVRNTDKLHEAIVNLTTRSIDSNVRLGPNLHAPADGPEIFLMERIVLEDEQVRAELAKLKLPIGTAVLCDPWIYGSDGVDDDRRMYQCFLYMRDPEDPENADSNHYAFPLPLSPVVDVVTEKIIRIDILPTGADATVKELSPMKPPKASEYMPEHQELRTDLKPLNVIQPKGASFKVTPSGETGHVVDWQKWRFRVGFNQREGMVLYDIRYDDRSLFYRASLSDMNIPYADPRAPFHRKSAFDLGDTGAGMMANNLKLGCDCLGSIHYLSATLSTDEGSTMPMENVICIHEQDAGIGWKHTNYRTNKAAVVRSRELVLQSIITVANYEYILAFIMNQAGEFSYEVRATGIVSTQPIDEGVSVPWGTVVHPGVLATHHQHIFSLRIDPAIDGTKNTLTASEVHPLPISDFNPHGNGYTVTESPVTTSGGLDINPAVNRVYKITNPARLNPINGKPVAYKILAPDFQKMVAHPSSFHHRRAEFADHNLYVTRHVDGELYAGGKYTNQSRGGLGVRSWAQRNDPIENEDLVLWIQFGLQHVTRVEDFPVMPCEILKVRLVPVNFFDKNPSLDVPPATQDVSRSVLINGNGVSASHGTPNGNAEAHHQPGLSSRLEANGNGAGPACCS